MRGCIAFDLARPFIGPLRPTPRGIDRVDLAYARHFFEQWRSDCVGILPTPWGIRWFDRDRSLRLVNFIEASWGETNSADADPAYRWLRDRLLGQGPSVEPSGVPHPAARLAAGIARLIRQAGFTPGHRITTLPQGTVYLNTGQIGLTVSKFLTWLAVRTDVKPVFVLQDVIPLEHPEYTTPWRSRAHRRMLVNTARYAKGLIVTTQAAGASIKRELVRLGGVAIPTLAAPLPVPSPFLEPVAPDPQLRGVAYFVVCGNIEPRKNHSLLLNVWRDLVARNDGNTPKLVIAGSRFLTDNAVLDMLQHCAPIKNFVIEIAGLSTPGLRQILANARALLMPSFAEGFGLPIVEALALGTPVVASDIPTHRETGGSFVSYLSPQDGSGWLDAIQSLASATPPGSRHRENSCYRPQTSADYFRKVEQFLGSL